MTTEDEEDEDAREFRETTEICRRWLKGKSPAHWLWLARSFVGSHGETHDERGIRAWIESQPEHKAALEAGCTEKEIEAIDASLKPYSDPATYDLYKNRLMMRKGVPRPGTAEWKIWWKKVGGNPERYWANEPLFGYPETILGHVARWGCGALSLAVVIWSVWAFYKIKAG